MNQTDTPRTDAVFIYDPESNEAELARQLERELTEARAEVEKANEKLMALSSMVAGAIAQNHELTEARAELLATSMCYEGVKAQLAALEQDKARLREAQEILEDCILGWGLGRPDHWDDADVAAWHKDYERAEKFIAALDAAKEAKP